MLNEINNEQKRTKDVKCPLNKKFYSPTVRITVSLREPDEESCSVFNYISLIAEEKRNRRREKETYALNGSVEDDDDDGDVKKIAQHFEEKYSGVGTKKKKKKKSPTFYNYTELAGGYDESDSFIDNSEVFDEALPDEMETFHGGYYVNCGQLEFKKVELADDNSDLDEIRVGKKKPCVLKSDDDSASDAGTVKSDDDKSDTEDEDAESAAKKLPEETDHEEIENEPARNNVIEVVNSLEAPKTENSKDCLNYELTMNGDITMKIKKKYKKRRLDEDEEGQADGSSKPKKKAITVKSMLEEKRIVENGDHGPLSIKPVENVHNSVNDIIESVVNAARNHSEDSRDSTCSSSDSKSVDSRTSEETEKESHPEDVETAESTSSVSGASSVLKEQVKLPDNLSSEILELISQIKSSAQTSDSGVRSFFNAFVNSKLLSLETKSRCLMSNKRHALYDYLASFLPCSKDTLMKRAKKLLMEEEERLTIEPLKKLKTSIENIMPALMDNYTAACQQAAEEKNVNDVIRNGDVDEKKSISSKMPAKKFVWTEETRGHLKELVACRIKCFQMVKPRKESSDEYVKKFLETKVKPLWPTGWMETSILLKEAQINTVSSKVRKSSSVNNANVSGSATATSTKKSHSTVSNIGNLDTTTMSAAANYNFLSSTLALQSLAMQYPPKSEVCYSAAPSASIPYPDLNMSLPGSSVDIFARIAMGCPQYPANHPYTKSTSPPKKQTAPSPSYPTQRSTTPVSVASSATSFGDKKKPADTSISKFNDFNIESLINSTKSKKEHHMLNHSSQYNKYYSHKTEKRKAYEKKDDNVPSKNVASHSNSSNHSVDSKTSKPGGIVGANGCVDSGASKTGIRDQVLDLSPPNKIVISEVECDNSVRKSPNLLANSRSETSSSIAAASSVTAKDHNYWASAVKKEDLMVKKKDTRQETQSAVSNAAEMSTLQSANPKPTHISRKQRLLQESAKSVTQDTVPLKSPDLSSSSMPDNAKPVQSAHSLTEMVHRQSESHSRAILKNDDKTPLSSTTDGKHSHEETTTAADFLKQIINDTLQSTPASLLPRLNATYERPPSPTLKRRNWESPTSPTSKKRTWSLERSCSPPTKRRSAGECSSLSDASSPSTPSWASEIPLSPNATSAAGKLPSWADPVGGPKRRSYGQGDPPSPRRRSNSILDDMKDTRVESEITKSEERVLYGGDSAVDIKVRPSSRESSSLPVPRSSNERKTPNSDRAEREAAEVIKELQVLSQIGGHTRPRRMDYQDSKNRCGSDMNYNNGSTANQSSLLSSDDKSVPLPRMTGGFQDEFFKHIFLNDKGGSTHTNNFKSQDNCFTSELPSLEIDQPATTSYMPTLPPIKPGTSTMFNYQQSVIMSPASAKWHSPESKS